MKTSAMFAILMAMATFMSALPTSHADFIKCREYAAELKKDFSTKQLIEHDLVFGTWAANRSDGIESIFLFTGEGMVQILNTDLDGHKSYESTFWRVAEFEGQPFLVISDNNRKEKLLTVDQTCDGVILRDVVSAEVLVLNYQPLKAAPKLNLTRAYLVGEWTNVSALEYQDASKKGQAPFLNYRFSANGTFTCAYGNQHDKVKQEGSWEISKDGQFLLLHVAEKDNIENIKGTEVIRIAQVDDHGMILEQVMKTNDVNQFFGSDNKTFTFIK